MSVDEVLFQHRVHGWSLLEGIIPPGEVTEVRESIEETAARRLGRTRGTNTESVFILFCINHHQAIRPVSGARAPARPHAGGVRALPPDGLREGVCRVSRHRAPTNRTAGLDLPIPHPGETQVTGAAGSVLLFDNRLWHTGGANRSDGPRVGMINVYFPWWLCQDQNMPRGNDARERLKEETGLRACVSYLQLDRVSIKRCVIFLSVGPKNHELPSRSVLSTRETDRMSQRYEKLKTLLKELFQLDQPDLDFGIYRVLHAKSAEVSKFLDEDLLPQVRAAFGQYRTADKFEIEKDLATAIEQARGLGVDPETTQKVKDLRARLESEAVDIGALESEVYDHLFGFFRRYYSEGDFLPKRVYKPGVYAIPYEGEEVTLHWANKDQYYIKTSEYLRDYAFRLRPHDEKKPLRVHFRLADVAEGEHGNVKAAEGKDRVFILAEPGESGHDFIAEEDGEQGKELVIRFEYRPATITDWPEEDREGKKNPPVQKDLSEHATRNILAATGNVSMEWTTELSKAHVMANGDEADYSRLEAHLKRYAARNTFDYFIHKDLGTFLRRELDFYIKNEVMHLDDVETESAPRVEQYLSKIKVIRKIAGKIIDFLAQLEDFQKKLWLKKKFVVETRYCITVGSIPEAFYAEIAKNEAQREEWVNLLGIDEIEGNLTTPGYRKKLKAEFLKGHPTLVVDTHHFDSGFTEQLLDALGDVDEKTDGVLFHSENFQALETLSERYRQATAVVFADPPYNTGVDGFLYKDRYQHSSWL